MKYIAIGLIKLYRLCIGPFIGQVCRFSPSCSAYAQEALEKHGLLKAIILTLKRLSKCHPWHKGGIDNVP